VTLFPVSVLLYGRNSGSWQGTVIIKMLRELKRMPSQQNWPPPIEPDLPGENDELLKALICAQGSKIRNRLNLISQMRRDTGKDLRSATTVVYDFCDRYQIFPKRRGIELLPSILGLIVNVAIACCLFAMEIHAPARFLIVVSLLVVQAALVFWSVKRDERFHRDAVEKLSS
jgi:hypothetical protein